MNQKVKNVLALTGFGALLGTTVFAEITKRALRRQTRQWENPKLPREPYREQIDARAQQLLEEYPPETLSITAEDGLTLKGKLFTPPDADKLVICVHGYHSDGLRDFAGMMAWYYIRRGWRVLLVDNRGHGESEGRNVGLGAQDRLDVLQWARYCAIRFGSRYPVVLHGLSMGATAVMMAAGLELPENVRAIVADCGYTNAWDEFTHVLRSKYHLPAVLAVPLADLAARWEMGSGLRDCDAITEVQNAKVPMLFIHGAEDALVPSWMSEAAYEVCPTPKMKWICPGAGHSMSWMTDEAGYCEQLDRFFAGVETQ